MENRFIKPINLGCAAAIGGVAFVVILSWLIDRQSFAAIDPTYFPMAFNTAVCFLLCAASLVLAGQKWHGPASALAAAVAVWGAATFIARLADLGPDIDSVILRVPSIAGRPEVGRMSINTSLGFTLSGIALAAAGRYSKLSLPAVLGTAFIGSIVACTGCVALLGHATGIKIVNLNILPLRMAPHTAFCFVLLGTAITLLAKQRTVGPPLWLPIPVFVGVMAATAMIVQGVRAQKQAELELSVRSDVGHVTQAVDQQLRQLFQAIDRIGQRWEQQRGTPRGLWQSDVSAHLRDMPFLSSLNWADAGGRIEWVMPGDGNFRLHQFDLRSDPDIASTLNWAIGLRAPRATRVLNGFPALSANAFLYLTPLYAEGRNDGFLVAVVDTGQLFGTILAGGLSSRLALTVTEDGREIFSNAAGRRPAGWAFTNQVSAANLGKSWVLTGSPDAALTASVRTAVAPAVGLVGLLIASLAGFSVWLGVRREGDLEKLKASEERLALAVSGTADGLWDWNIATGHILRSPRLLEILDHDDNGTLPPTPIAFLKRVHPEDRRKVVQAVRVHLKERTSFSVIFRFNRRDGQEIWLNMRGQGVWDENGRPRRLIGFISDVTESKHAERKMLAYAAELERSNRELDEFAYIASHDLKAPLRVINNASRWLEEDLAPHMSAEDLVNMDILRSRVRRMEKLLDDLLEYSRVGRSTDERFNETINGQALMENIMLLLSPPAAFEVRVSPAFAAITVKRMPVQQLLFNLIANAIKHHDRKAGLIEVDVKEEGDHYLFTVKDDGPGIPPKFHEQVFKMFQTLKPRDQVEGSGMGLAFVKKTVDHFGGKISLVSEEGKGAAFSFTWPKEPQAKAALLGKAA